MAFFINNLFIFIIYYSYSFSKENHIHNLNIYNDELSNIIYPSNFYEKNDYFSSEYFTIDEAITIFPVAYLAYIINGFLPASSNNVNGIANIIMSKSKCFRNLLIQYKSDPKFIYNSIRYSGKTYPDFGDEEGCISNNQSFVLFCISFNISEPTEYSGKYKLLPFILNGHSFYGLCIDNSDECTEDLRYLLEEPVANVSFNNKYNLTTLINNPLKGPIKNENRYLIFKIIMSILAFIVLLKIFIDIIALKIFKDEEKQNVKKKGSDSSSSSSSSSSNDEEESKSSTKTDDKEKDKNQLLIEKKEDIPKLSKKEKYSKLYYLYKILSLKIGFRHLFKNKGKLFDESDLHLIIFFKFLSLIFKTLYMNINLMIRTPSKEINNVRFFENPFIINLIKYSSFSDVIFIISESIIVAYKLMSFIRKYTGKNEEPSFKLFLNFFLRIFPSIFTTLLYFFIFYFFSESMMLLVKSEEGFKRTRLQHMRNNLINCNSCINDISDLIPFHMQYNENSDCFQFMIIMMNLFYCYIIFILLMYIGFKVKNKIYDYIIAIILLIIYIIPNDIIPIFKCKTMGNTLNINLLFGETCSYKFTHLFIKYYFLGFLIGLSIFYNNDITHENSLQNSPIYKPFHFLQDIIGFIYLRTFCIKLLIILLMIAIQILLSSTFFVLYKDLLLSLINNDTESDYTMHYFDTFLYFNEKSIFAFSFGLMLLVLYTFKNEAIIRGFCNNILVILFNRTGYGYYAIIEIIINYIYCSIELEVQLNSTNILFLTSGIIFYIWFCNLLVIPVFEIPIKLLIKKMLQLETEEKRIFTI